MSVDVNAVKERLNGLVTLLKAVGVDDLNTGDVQRVSKGLRKNGGLGLPDARQLNDEQIELIIRKLQMAQQEAPQIIAALEAHAEARSLNGSDSRPRPHQQQRQQYEDDEDDDDEIDEDANYPMVGSGCSDDVSIMSDLTTPTVVNDRHVPEEEHYRDTLPPMIVGGGGDRAPPMMIAPTKRKNLVNSVRPGMSRGARPGLLAPPSRGAAAARQKRYQDTMHKLQQESPTPSTKRILKVKKDPTKKSSSSTRRPTSSSENTHSHKEFNARNEWESENAGRSSAPTRKSKPKKSSATTAIDDDGFLVGDSFDPFASSDNNPFASRTTSAGDLAFSTSRRDPFSSSSSANGFDAFGGASGSRKLKKKPERSIESSFSSSRSKEGNPRSSATGGATPRRRARRASLAM
ncbi:predicted protein [Phaeodactylum tricornutum CCAP 1055/1]|jgi:hypothetical protein|uniref:Uncharacterized protein n=1 Tax=Phaeodactylum tricornutum (strain CCAP 1055/1) TaxID=556484 RepID=B7GBB1_PHATC|nr:predicted protein [Phaeodactylum tricornutum CCAP 1055/1]EEC44085.1 predicted protein [Phaeodactylum tricornutum CCAP 1055/1]|eukprot:XP_002184336.1 predicted protein [Phaeodactylum tricornutum CCAP 1055/1]